MNHLAVRQLLWRDFSAGCQHEIARRPEETFLQLVYIARVQRRYVIIAMVKIYRQQTLKLNKNIILKIFVQYIITCRVSNDVNFANAVD
jgi:hypothetical protein